jgi:REP element-mobilizing transposase RayT
MGHQLRMFEASDCWFITVRNFQARKLMTPRTHLVRQICGGILARALRRHSLQLHGYVFLSNHLHLIIRGRGPVIADFMKYLLANLSKKLAPICGTRWSGRFWERRYAATPILDETALEERLQYIASHGVKEGLVSHARSWEGLHCVEQLIDGSPRAFKWFDWTKRWTTKHRDGCAKLADSGRYSRKFAEAEVLQLAPLPQWAHHPPKKRRRLAIKLVAAVERTHRKPHPIGMALVKRQDTEPPATTKRAPRPWCHATTPETRADYRERYHDFALAHRSASIQWLQGATEVWFPPGSFKPFVRDEARTPPSLPHSTSPSLPS